MEYTRKRDREPIETNNIGQQADIPFRREQTSMKYVRVGKVGDFAAVEMRSYRVLARYVGVFRRPDGSFFAREAGCKHANADLTRGRREGNVLTCPWHGWKYDIETGECLWGTNAQLRPYGIRIEGEDILVTLQPLEERPSSEEDENP